MSSFRGLRETIEAHGLFGSFYTDRGSHYFHMPVADGPVDKKTLTQVGRALKQLGIRHIPSYTPEGRGRMERVFRTLRQRLAPMLRRAGLLTVETANAYLPRHVCSRAQHAVRQGRGGTGQCVRGARGHRA